MDILVMVKIKESESDVGPEIEIWACDDAKKALNINSTTSQLFKFIFTSVHQARTELMLILNLYLF